MSDPNRARELLAGEYANERMTLGCEGPDAIEGTWIFRRDKAALRAIERALSVDFIEQPIAGADAAQRARELLAAESGDGPIGRAIREGTSFKASSSMISVEKALRAIERALNGERDAILEECAKVAEGWPVNAAGDDYQTCGNGSFWDEGTNYDQGRADAAAAIRALKSRGDHLRIDDRGDGD
jgi:hypothetical protein